MITVEPQHDMPENQVILAMARHFNVNGLQMRKKLLEGFTVQARLEELDSLTLPFDNYGIKYSVNRPDDPRNRYPYFDKCRYPYSPMNHYRNHDLPKEMEP